VKLGIPIPRVAEIRNCISYLRVHIPIFLVRPDDIELIFQRPHGIFCLWRDRVPIVFNCLLRHKGRPSLTNKSHLGSNITRSHIKCKENGVPLIGRDHNEARDKARIEPEIEIKLGIEVEINQRQRPSHIF